MRAKVYTESERMESKNLYFRVRNYGDMDVIPGNAFVCNNIYRKQKMERNRDTIVMVRLSQHL